MKMDELPEGGEEIGLGEGTMTSLTVSLQLCLSHCPPFPCPEVMMLNRGAWDRRGKVEENKSICYKCKLYNNNNNIIII